MKVCVKLFIYLAIIVIIAIFNNADMANAKYLTRRGNLAMAQPTENLPKFEGSLLRMRRGADQAPADEGDIPKGELNERTNLRSRRQTPPGESDIPKGIQKDAQLMREKRQMPSPPQGMPMPPM